MAAKAQSGQAGGIARALARRLTFLPEPVRVFAHRRLMEALGLVFLLAGLAFAAALGSAASLDCLEAGFTASLRCSSCAKLESLVPDPELAADCGACCSEDLSASASYASAILEVCE